MLPDLIFMHTIEPYYNWRDQYISEEDQLSPFYQRTYNDFAFTQTIYNYFIHPYWDDFGSRTLYIKILFADYDQHFAILELIGEWNDAIENDIMTLKEEVIDWLLLKGISKFIFIMENVLNFHSADKDYYEEWFEEVTEENGWIVFVNMSTAAQQDFRKRKLNYLVELMEIPEWRTFKPEFLYALINDEIMKRLPE